MYPDRYKMLFMKCLTANLFRKYSNSNHMRSLQINNTKNDLKNLQF